MTITLINGHRDEYGDLSQTIDRELHLAGWLIIILGMKTFLAHVDSRYHICLNDMLPKITNHEPCYIAQLKNLINIPHKHYHTPNIYYDPMVKQSRVINVVEKFYSENMFETILKSIFPSSAICAQIFNAISGHLRHDKLIYIIKYFICRCKNIPVMKYIGSSHGSPK